MDAIRAQELFTAANELFAQGAHRDALFIICELYAEYPDNAEILHALAQCRYKVGQLDAAKEQALRLSNEFGDPRGRRMVAAWGKPRPVVPDDSYRARPIVPPAAAPAKPQETHWVLLSETQMKCPKCDTKYGYSPPNRYVPTSRCGVCSADLITPELPESFQKIRNLVLAFDENDGQSESAHRELVKLGNKAIPSLLDALKGGLFRRYWAARTLGTICMNGRSGLTSVNNVDWENMRKALGDALNYERTEESGAISDQICMQLERAINNLAG
jgi:hypothetical protein